MTSAESVVPFFLTGCQGFLSAKQRSSGCSYILPCSEKEGGGLGTVQVGRIDTILRSALTQAQPCRKCCRPVTLTLFERHSPQVSEECENDRVFPQQLQRGQVEKSSAEECLLSVGKAAVPAFCSLFSSRRLPEGRCGGKWKTDMTKCF